MSDKVGYKKPPKHSQFEKGQSGNPKGRPKGSGTLLGDLMRDLSKEIGVTENGRKRKLTRQQAMITAMVNAGIRGDMRAAALVLTWLPRLIDMNPEALADPGLSASDRDNLEAYIKRRSEQLALEKEDQQ